MFLDLSVKSTGSRYHVYAVYDGVRHRQGRSYTKMRAAASAARRMLDNGAREAEVVNTRTRKVFRIE